MNKLKLEALKNLTGAFTSAVVCCLIVVLCIKNEILEFGILEAFVIAGFACLFLVNLSLAAVNMKLSSANNS